MNKSHVAFMLFCLLSASVTSETFGDQNLPESQAEEENNSLYFEYSDIRKRNISRSDLTGKIIIMGFSTQETSDDLIEWQTYIGYETRITLGGYEDIFVITVASVSHFPWIVKPIVKSRLKGIYKKSNRRLLKRFEEHKIDPPEDLEDTLFLVPDWSGEILETFGMEKEMDKPHLFVIDQSGKIVGHFTKDVESSNNKIVSLVKNLLEQDTFKR